MAHWYEQVKTIPKTPVLTKKTILLRFGTYEKGDSWKRYNMDGPLTYTIGKNASRSIRINVDLF